MMNKACILLYVCSSLIVANTALAAPKLFPALTAEDIPSSANSNINYPLFDKALDKAKNRVERSIKEGVIVPLPKDPGGGFTHERHKENYKIIRDSGILFQITRDKRYLNHSRNLLLAYADMYKKLPLHPARKKKKYGYPGKLFWQGLNESVWLVHTVQGYDAISEALTEDQRAVIENDLLRKVADFLSIENSRTFQKIHNHATWAAAAVGMTGYALADKTLIDRAITGLEDHPKSGFLVQMEQLFSPDGYYTEGPYYQRYALMPFILFAQVINRNEPERKIFEYRNNILLKAIDATIQQSYAGKFFPINDAIKEKGIDTQELVHAVAAAYEITARSELLSIADYQGRTVLSRSGLSLAKAAVKTKIKDFNYRSMLLRDGPNGDQGGLAILRMGSGELAQTLVMKNTGQGFGHGHFDKLSYIFYDDGQEILTDYGAARFLNVPTKNGGRYLPENKSWAKQTVAHNTLVVNETSQFLADWRKSQKHWANIEYFHSSDELNISSASLADAYPGTKIRRTVIQMKHKLFSHPIIIDLMSGESNDAVKYDLPFYFKGQVINFNGIVESRQNKREPLGSKFGYQHLWIEGSQKLSSNNNFSFSWLNKNRFYTLHSYAPGKTQAFYVRTGSNDPDFNLRSEQGVILRAPKRKNIDIVSVVEAHGIYDPSAEITLNSESSIDHIEHLKSGDRHLIRIVTKSKDVVNIAISHDPGVNKSHTLSTKGRTWQWSGFADIIEEKRIGK